MFALLFLAFVELETLPVVEEKYDAVVICRNEETWSLGRAYFIRDGRVIAERVVDDEWTFDANGERPAMLWDDYGTRRRRVECDVLIWGSVAPVKQEDPAAPWFAQGRRMADLLAPPRAD